MRSALIEQGASPWDVTHRRVWPRSFRVAVRGVMRTAFALASREGDDGRSKAPPTSFWIRMLSFCSRDWFAPLSPEEASVQGPPPTRIFWCDWCQVAPIQRKLQVCKACYQARYCSKECLVEAWNPKIKPHKVLCRAVQAEKSKARPKKAS